MMDEKMKAAFVDWVEKQPLGGWSTRPEAIIEWTLDYLRSQQGRDNSARVDKGALKMAENVLRRAGKTEVADALVAGVSEPHPTPSAPAVPDGWKLVPEFLNVEMKQAGDRVDLGDTDIGEIVLSWDEYKKLWAAFLAAAPSPTEKKKENPHD